MSRSDPIHGERADSAHELKPFVESGLLAVDLTLQAKTRFLVQCALLGCYFAPPPFKLLKPPRYIVRFSALFLGHPRS